MSMGNLSGIEKRSGKGEKGDKGDKGDPGEASLSGSSTDDLQQGGVNLYATQASVQPFVDAGIAAHVAAADPHTQYLTAAEGAAAFDAIGAADAKVIDSIADSDTTHAPSRNAVFDALALKRALTTPVTTQVGSYTLVLADANSHIRMNVAGANTLTVPPNSTVAFPIGTEFWGEQAGAGATTITAGAGVTFRSTVGNSPSAQYGVVGWRKVATDTWSVISRT